MGVAAGESLGVNMVEMEETQNYHKRVQIVHHVTLIPVPRTCRRTSSHGHQASPHESYKKCDFFILPSRHRHIL